MGPMRLMGKIGCNSGDEDDCNVLHLSLASGAVGRFNPGLN